MENQDQQEQENILRAKQAISPAGLSDRSDKAQAGPAAEIDPAPLDDDPLEDEYMDGDKPGGNARLTHPNRNPNPKPDLDKPSYS